MSAKITANVPTLGEEADLEAQTFYLAQTPIESMNVQFSTKPLFCQTCVNRCLFFTNILKIIVILFCSIKISRIFVKEITTKTIEIMKALSNNGWLKRQLEVNKQLFELGLISHVEKLSQDIIAKATHKSQIQDSL